VHYRKTTARLTAAAAAALIALTLGVSAAPSVSAQPASLALGVESPVAPRGVSTGSVTLPSPAPAGGAVVTLVSSAPGLVSVPANVTVPAGGRTATFQVDATASDGPTCVLITATSAMASQSSVAYAVAEAAQPAVGSSYVLSELPLPEGVDFGGLGSSNTLGQAVGQGVTISALYQNRALQWEGGQVKTLPLLAPNDHFAVATEINAAGQILGSVETAANSGVPVIWHNGNATALPLPFGGRSANPTGINAHGVVIGTATRPGVGDRPVLWKAGAASELGTVPQAFEGMPYVLGANDINDCGYGVGYGSAFTIMEPGSTIPPQPFPERAFLFTPSGQTVELGQLGAEPKSTFARAINNDGHIVGTTVTGTAVELVTWHTSNPRAATAHGALPGDNRVDPRSVNAWGQVVGSSWREGAEGEMRGFLWRNGAFTDLNQLVPAWSGWSNVQPGGINDAGQIAGSAVLDGMPRPILLTPKSGVGLPTLTSVSPSSVVAGSESLRLTATGSGFVPGSTVLWNGTPRLTTYVSSTQLMAMIPAADLASGSELSTALVTVATVARTGGVSHPMPVAIAQPIITEAQSAVAVAGETVTVATHGAPALAASLANRTDGSQPAVVSAARYASNPTSSTLFDVGGGYLDLQISGADPSDVVAANYYYPGQITGETEAALELRYWNGTTFEPVLSSGGVAPAKDTTDNLDGTASGGRILVTFDQTSTPTLMNLTGTVFTFVAGSNPNPGDAVAPVTTATQSNQPNTVGWHNADVTVTLHAADGATGSGVKELVYSAAGAQPIATTAILGDAASIDIRADGTTTLTFFARDKKGNQEDASVLTVRVDKTPPSVSFSPPDTAPNAAGWTNKAVSIPFVVTDSHSGVDATKSTASPLLLTREGAEVTDSVHVTDKAGNTRTITSPSVNIDRTPPVVTALRSGTANAAGWYADTVVLTLSAADAFSGTDSIEYALNGGAAQAYTQPVSIAQDGSHAVTFSARDVAGNAALVQSISVSIDRTQPSATVTTQPGTMAAGHQLVSLVGTATVKTKAGATAGTIAVQCFNTAGLTFRLKATDSTSGVASVAYTSSGAQKIPTTTISGSSASQLISAEGFTTMSYAAIDTAGNRESNQSLRIVVGNAEERANWACAGPAPTFAFPAHGSLAIVGSITIKGVKIPIAKTIQY